MTINDMCRVIAKYFENFLSEDWKNLDKKYIKKQVKKFYRKLTKLPLKYLEIIYDNL